MDFVLHRMEKDIEIEGFYTLFYQEHTKDFYFPGERHDFWEMVYVDDGEIDIVAENTGYCLKQGDVAFHKPMEFHTVASNQKDPHSIIVATFETHSPAMRYFENRILRVDAGQKRVLSLFLQEMEALFGGDMKGGKREAPVGAGQLLVSYFEEFLLSLLRAGTGSGRAGYASGRAKRNVENVLAGRIEAYLCENAPHPLSLSTVCAEFHMSRSYLCRVFAESMGTGIMERHCALRLDEAKRLIRRGEQNVTEIADALGYSSIHHFTRSFKQHTGLTPTAYAKSVRDGSAQDELIIAD